MNREQFSKLCEEFFEEQRKTLVSKGAEYSKDADVLENFKRTAQDYGVTVPQSWGSHFDKHVSAIRKFCKSGYAINEPIRGRILDAANYLLLLLAHVDEESAKGGVRRMPGAGVFTNAITPLPNGVIASNRPTPDGKYYPPL